MNWEIPEIASAGSTTIGASSTASSTSISLNTKTADDVSKVEVKNNSDSYTVEMKSEDSYSVEGLDGFDLNKTSISALKSDSAGVASTQLVEEQAEDLSIYGLDSPKAEATITYKDGETLSLAVGNEAAGQKGVVLLYKWSVLSSNITPLPTLMPHSSRKEFSSGI